jgi:hypothetical protein
MSKLLDLTEGWTGPLPFTLKADGTAVNLTGMTVTMVLKDNAGNDVTTTGDVVITTAASGLVTYTPDATDLLASGSPYTVRFQVVDGSSQTVFFPNGQPDEIKVWKP